MILLAPSTDMKREFNFYKHIFETSPVGMAIYDFTGQCVEANRAICKMIGGERKQVLAQNFNHLDSWKKSGLLEIATKAVKTRRRTQKTITIASTFGSELTANVFFMPLAIAGENYLLCTFDDLSEIQRLADERERLIVELRKTVDEVNVLRSILPLCCFCKKIRDDEGYWEQVDVYIHKHKLVDISHSICPECARKHYPQFNGQRKADGAD